MMARWMWTRIVLASLLVILTWIGQLIAQEPVVPAGINARFKDPALNVSEWLGRFEVESREIYQAREQILAACRLRPGEEVADVGAGTGFFSRLFADAVGDSGWVYSIDIATPFLKHISNRALEENVGNLTTVLCNDQSIGLPPQTVDCVFICDTYHHFENPFQTLASIADALRPGGRLILIDFERIDGVSRQWTIDHVRAGKEVFRREVVDAGFEFAGEVNLDALNENYLLRFIKPTGDSMQASPK